MSIDHSNLARPTHAVINLDALASNFRTMRGLVGGETKIMAVVKANAYGHGAVECSKLLESLGADWFGVALPEEGVELRNAGIKTPILCLNGFWHGQESLVIDHGLTPVIFRSDLARSLNAESEKRGVVTNIHLQIDTGMRREGVLFSELSAFAAEIAECKDLNVEGLMTHFSSADDIEAADVTRDQIDLFQKAIEIIRKSGSSPSVIDAANSPGTIGFPESRFSMIRLGGILYGLIGDMLPRVDGIPDLRPVMSLRTKITDLKRIAPGETVGYGRTFQADGERLAALIPIGYNDGLPRSLSNRGHMIVHGQKAPIIGRISMDWTVIDVTDVKGVSVDDEVVVLGSQTPQMISAESIAADAETISYEITCGISGRIPRVFKR